MHSPYLPPTLNKYCYLVTETTQIFKLVEKKCPTSLSELFPTSLTTDDNVLLFFKFYCYVNFTLIPLVNEYFQSLKHN